MDRRSSMDYFNQKYSRRSVGVIAPEAYSAVPQKRMVASIHPPSLTAPINTFQTQNNTFQINKKVAEKEQGASEGKRICGCRWWICLFFTILGLILIGIIIGFVTGLFGNKSILQEAVRIQGDKGGSTTSGNMRIAHGRISEHRCNRGFIGSDEKWSKCPYKSNCNRYNCIFGSLRQNIRR